MGPRRRARQCGVAWIYTHGDARSRHRFRRARQGTAGATFRDEFLHDNRSAIGEATLAAGNYSFTVEAKVGGEKVEAKAMQIGMVNAVVRNNNGFSLDLGSMGEVSFSDVHKII